MSDNRKFRLVTRSDFDGLVCGALLKELDMVESVKFVHPKDMQDGKIEITDDDITANLPYVKGVHLCFDHHSSEFERLGEVPDNLVNDPKAPSAARVVYDHYGGKSRFPKVSDDLMEAVDKTDSAQFSLEEVLNPKGWELLGFLLDSRTGLGRFREFRISNYQLMEKMIDLMRTAGIDEILGDPDVKERVDLYRSHDEKFKEQLWRCAKVHQNLVVLDLRGEDVIYAGNRFLVYGLFPECNISVHLMWGFKQQNTVCAIGKSILNRSSKTDVGSLCLKYGGGGHKAAGTCQLENDQVDTKLPEIIAQITADG